MTAEPGAQRRERVVPTGTYRFQIQGAFTFDDAAAQVAYVDSLGVSHAYLSPVLAATKGSTHGYDVVDHSRLNPEAGGREGFDRLTDALAERGLAAVADVVPNHMAVPTPASANRQLWSVMREGPASPFAKWFDVDWSVPDRALLVPVLGQRIGQVLAAGEISLDSSGAEPVLRYYEHVFPVRPGTEHLPLPKLVDRQWYRLAHWRVADEELNYRRFFDVDTLAAIRVEDEEVFAASHELLLDLLHNGRLDGLRIDHPDGLADPAGYLRRLRAATDRGDGGAWVVVEKILEGDEALVSDWACDGTTGYDALHVVGGLFLDPAGAAPLLAHYTTLTGDTADFHEVVDRAKREVVEHGLYAEVHRLVDLLVEICHADVDLRDHTRRGLHESVVELLVAMDRYRAYVVPGEPAPEESVRVVTAATERARHHLPAERHDTLQVVADLALGRGATDSVGDGVGSAAKQAEFVIRFQQTCGPVMAKGVEDTAFYRWFRLSSLNEVGGDPARFGVAPEEFHAYSSRMARDWPATMTTLSTHDTKRSEDVRAQLSGLSERHEEWHQALTSWREAAGAHREAELDARTEVLIWQSIVGTWGTQGPISSDRLVAYLEKATREAKDHTTWTSPDEAYETAVRRFVEGVLGDETLMAGVGEFVAALATSTRTAVLGQKLLQLVMPGVPDVYQGSELVDLSLVDPDNRRPVDYAERRRRLEALDGGGKPSDLDDEKLLVTSRVLRLRREHREWFLGPDATYAPVPTTTGHAVALARGDAAGARVIAVATRLPVALERNGGWGEHTLTLPEGRWRCALSGVTATDSSVRLADLLQRLPVALLVRED
ncbi:(1-_4)-alpha-D-glucan 1-alpha-D-glucosylmutase [Kineococcus xinjiangensis]|uniref:(1->4)-alpha-D-glucan 1-alpha-D-glucosylmutase n=1 Tax=Kineococcus xinjiangensis TaxID=512762 RepID=A0A2S6INY9_9ACTN|nr:malto-oligosyltrehalose synthase [Kineococcus xinjiangensis]PPK95939.1 (1->4)-alpha-D-glucan 1-alpha-D-glucosylmutase [Kineococcus xinjiangensis]